MTNISSLSGEEGDICAGVVHVVRLEAVALEVVWPLLHLGVLQPAPHLLLLAEAGQLGQATQPTHRHPGAGLHTELASRYKMICYSMCWCLIPINDFKSIFILIIIPINDFHMRGTVLMQTMSLLVFLFDPTDDDFLRFVFFPLQHRKFTQESNMVFADVSQFS